jgi:hypothetical protein
MGRKFYYSAAYIDHSERGAVRKDKRMEVTTRRGRRREKLLADLKDSTGYCHLKEKALDRTVRRNRFGRGFEPFVSQIEY